MGGCRETTTNEIIGVQSRDCKRRVSVVVLRVNTYVFWECVLQENVVFHWHRQIHGNKPQSNELNIYVGYSTDTSHPLC